MKNIENRGRAQEEKHTQRANDINQLKKVKALEKEKRKTMIEKRISIRNGYRMKFIPKHAAQHIDSVDDCCVID